MLHILRKHRNRVFGFIITALAIGLMLPFGTSFFFRNAPNDRDMIKITFPSIIDRFRPVEISATEFQRNLLRSQELFRQQLGKNYAQFAQMLNLEQRTVDELIDKHLLEKFSSRLGLWAGSNQIEQELANMPYFGGKLTQESYSAFLDAQGMTALKFESELRSQLIGQQIRTLLSDLNQPTNYELKQLYLNENRKADFQYIKFETASFTQQAESEDEDKIKQYFLNHQEEYRKPRSVSFQFASFPAESYAAQVEIVEEDLQEGYRQMRHTFQVPKQIHLSRILFKKKPAQANPVQQMVAPDVKTTEDLGKAAAEKALERLRAGEKFESLAVSLSKDPTAAKTAGNLGWKPYSALEPAVRTAITNLAVDELSGVIETKEGYEIFLVKDRKESFIKPFEEVRSEVEKAIRKDAAPDYALAAAESFLAEFEKQSGNEKLSLADFAARKAIPFVAAAGFLSRTDTASGVPQGLIEKVINFTSSQREVVEVSNNAYLVDTLEVKEAYIPEFSEIKDSVKKDYVKFRADQLAKEAAEQVLEQFLGKGTSGAAPKPLTQIAAEKKVKLEQIKSAIRKEPSTDGVLSDEENKRLAFSLSLNKPKAQKILNVPDGYIILELTASHIPEDKDYTTEKQNLKNQELAQSSTRLFTALLKALRKEADIWVNTELLKRPSDPVTDL